MTAFLYIASACGPARGRRVDFANIANLFAEIEPPLPRRDHAPVRRMALAILVLLGLLGDTLLVARADTLANCFASGRSVQAAPVTTGRS